VFFRRQTIVKAVPGANTVLSAMDCETNWALLLASALAVPLARISVALGDALGVASVVAEGWRVAVGLGGAIVAEGVWAIWWATWASTVAATSVRMGFKSWVGALVGATGLHAASNARLTSHPMMDNLLLCDVIVLFLYRDGVDRGRPPDYLVLFCVGRKELSIDRYFYIAQRSCYLKFETLGRLFPLITASTPTTLTHPNITLIHSGQ